MTATMMQSRVRAAIGDALNALGADMGLPGLSWVYRSEDDGSRINGHATSGFYGPDEVAVITAGWAKHLGLSPKDTFVSGTVEYVGTVDGLPFSIWGVVDPDAFHKLYQQDGAE